MTRKMNRHYIIPMALLATLCACSADESVVEKAPTVNLNAQWADDNGTRTTMDANDKVYWNANDQINCNGATSTNAAMGSGSSTADQYSTATFTVDASSPYYAMYPAKMNGSDVTYSGGTFSFSFPATQPYNNDISFSKGYNPSTAYSTSTGIYFYNSCGIVKATLSGNFKAVRKARFMSAASTLSGNAKVVVPTESGQGGSMVMNDTYAKGSNDYIDVDFGSDKNLSTTPATVYWILPPQAYNAPTVKLLNGDGKTVGQITASGTVNVKRAVITNLKTVTPFMSESYPIWEDAKGLVSDIKYVTTADANTTPKGYTDLSTTRVIGSNTGIANCYVVPAGNSNTQWCIPVKNANGWIQENTYICFTVNAGLHGNALLGFSTADEANSQTSSYSSNYAEKAWSWHIWVPSITPAEETLTTGFTELDMSLGAVDKTLTQCTLYQWGRKDPFNNQNANYCNVDGEQVEKDVAMKRWTVISANFVTAENTDAHTNGSYDYKHPDVFIYAKKKNTAYLGWLSTEDDTRWGYPDYTKTVNDPCPAGYQVIYSTDAWSGSYYQEAYNSGNKGGNYYATNLNAYPSDGNTTNAAFYPYCQHLAYNTGFNAECHQGHVWSAVPNGKSFAYCLHNNYAGDESSVTESQCHTMGYSVRCVKAK
jgi:hypothetical protein